MPNNCIAVNLNISTNRMWVEREREREEIILLRVFYVDFSTGFKSD